MAQVSVRNSVGTPVNIEKPLPPGREAAANSRPVAISTEDKTALDAAVTALQIIDDWDESDRAKVNPIVGQAGVAANAGAVGATTQRVTLASDDPAVAVLGAPTGAAVVTDADGTIQRYLRGIVKLLITSGTIILGAGANLIGKVDHAATGIAHGVKTVTTAGTDEALAGSTAAKWVIIQAQTDNTNYVAVGATGVDATVATGNGLLLAPGEWTPQLMIDNLADLFVDSLVNGEGVRFIYGT